MSFIPRPSLTEFVFKYLLVVVITVLAVIGLSFVHTLVIAFFAGINTALPLDLRFNTLSVTQVFELAFRIILFIVFIPLGLTVWLVSVFLNPVMQFIVFLGNIVVDIGNSIFQGFGWHVNTLIWSNIDTSRWLLDFATLVDQGIRILLG